MVGRLRLDHVAELAARGLTEQAAFDIALRYSIEAWTAFEGLEPVGMWGLTVPSLLGDEAHPWLLPTPALLRHRVRFWREMKAGVAGMLARYPVLSNDFDRSDAEACRLLRRLGFKRVGAGRYGGFVLTAK